MEVFFNFVTRFLCFLYVSQFLSVFCLSAFNFSGKTDWSIDLLIKTLMGFVITGCANLMILFILGWVFIYFDVLISYIFGYIHKKLLNISVTSFGSFTILSFSHKIMLLFDFIPLFDKKGLMVGLKVDDFGPPAVLSKKYVFMEVFFNFVTRFLCFLYVSQFLSVFCLRNLLWYIFFL